MDQKPTPVAPAYISNPFNMIGPSATAMGVNISTLFALLGLQFVPLLPLIFAIALGFAGRSNPVFIGVSLTLGIATVAAMMVIGLISLPTYSLILLASADGQKVALKETLLRAKPYIWRTLGIAVLTVLAVIGGLILFIIPGLIFAAWFILAEYVLLTENLGVVASMKRSKELVKGRTWEIWGVWAIPSVASLVPYLGGLLNMVLGVILMPAMAIRYRQLVTFPVDQRPKVHWSNKVLALVPVIIMVLVLVGVTVFATLIGTGKINVNDTNTSSTYYNY